jgi:hypothetical protein
METKLIFDCTKPLPPFEFPALAKAPKAMVEAVDLQKVNTYKASDNGKLW